MATGSSRVYADPDAEDSNHQREAKRIEAEFRQGSSSQSVDGG
jgi:hypothetical protein